MNVNGHTPSYYLALDLGAESGRAIVGALDDGHLTLSETHRFANLPVSLPGGLHWDVLGLWREIKKGIAASTAQYPIGSVGVDAWGLDFALLDKKGDLLENPFHYRDNRTKGMFDEAFRYVLREEIFEQTGAQFMEINTLYQLLAMVSNGSPVLDAAVTFLTIPDLFNFWLSGKVCCEFTNATTTQCFNPRQRSWAVSLLESLRIPTRLFPALIEPGRVLGTMLPGVVAETGASPIPIVVPACHDTGSAVAAVPAEKKDFFWISSGTWSIAGCEIEEPCITPFALAHNLASEGGVFGTWRLSKNIIGLWLVQECRRTWRLQGDDSDYAQITESAAKADAFTAVINPDDPSFLKPGNMPERIRAFCAETGQRVPQTKGETIRVILESIALKYRFVLERIEEATGKRLAPAHIIGGGTKNRFFNQCAADAMGRECIVGPTEAAAVGNILMQAVALGQVGSLEEMRAVVRRSFAHQVYEPATRTGWEDAYGRFLEIMNHNREVK